MFCGDLNSDPFTGLHEFITTKTVSSKHADWFAGMYVWTVLELAKE